MEVAPGVHQIRFTGPNRKFWVFAYLITNGEETALVDTGWATPSSYDELTRQVEESGCTVSDIKTVIITHLHPDHFGLAGRIKNENGAQVVFHELEKPLVETRYRSYSKLLDQLAVWLLSYGVPEDEMAEMQTASVPVRRFVLEADPDQTVVGGEQLRLGGQVWQTIWTPGHTRGHICLYNRDARLFISGDHILPGITPNISLHPESSENPLGDYIDSLRKVQDLHVDLVLPAHEHTFTKLAQRVREIEAHHEDRLESMRSVITDEPQTGYKVASEIRWNVGEFKDFDVHTRRGAVMETLAHLEYLRRKGRVEKLLIDGVYHYRSR